MYADLLYDAVILNQAVHHRDSSRLALNMLTVAIATIEIETVCDLQVARSLYPDTSNSMNMAAGLHSCAANLVHQLACSKYSPQYAPDKPSGKVAKDAAKWNTKNATPA